MAQKANHPNVENYLDAKNSEQRLAILKEFDSIEFGLARDLLELDLPLQEKLQLLAKSQCSSSLHLEQYYIAALAGTQQDIGITAIEAWLQKTDRHLWYLLLNIAKIPHLPQRLRYRLLDEAAKTGGVNIIKQLDKYTKVEEFSPAFHAIFLLRATQWQHSSEKLKSLAIKIISSINMDDSGSEKSIASAISYLACQFPEELNTLFLKSNDLGIWKSFLKGITASVNNPSLETKSIESLLKRKYNKNFRNNLRTHWPELWSRHLLEPKLIAKTLEILTANPPSPEESKRSPDWNLFSAITSECLDKALELVKDDVCYAQCLELLQDVVDPVKTSAICASLATRLQNAAEPVKIITVLCGRIKDEILFLDKTQDTPKNFEALFNHRQSFFEEWNSNADVINWEFPAFEKNTSTDENRQAFFDTAYRLKTPNHEFTPNNYWQLLNTAWINQNAESLDDLAKAARKMPHLFQLSFLNVLGRFKANDKAALKLLDYIRIEDDLTIKIVLKALHGIGTPRAAMELIASLTRPNTSLALQIEISSYLKDLDIENLQSELRSAINELAPSPDTADGRWELKETLKSLLTASAEEAPPEQNQKNTQPTATSADLDKSISKKIPNYARMSSEVKRALRTAEFFDSQVSQSNSQNSIDLSPVIDMQYKAMEIAFREMFEETCKALIHGGSLQRKLDVIGYARPIEQQMTKFETYLSRLPVIETIPFFSKFKLRKMLRAICQYRPGKRFTLDGLKAFGLFFLCFGRQNDNYGLNSIMNLPFKTDEALFEFCKNLHQFQDFRNRAAHEGFQPGASQDINAIWQLTAEICQAAFLIKDYLDDNPIEITKNYTANSKGNSNGVKIVHKKAG